GKSRASVVEAPDERISVEPEPTAISSTGEAVEERPRRVRATDALRVTAGILVTIAAALACVFGMLKYTRTSPRFAVRTVQVQGSSHRSPEDIALLGGIANGQNVFTL